MSEQQNIKISLGDGTDFKIISAGEMPGPDGKLIQWDDSIKLVQGKTQIKLSPVALSQLIKATQREDIKKVLQARFQAEIKKLQKLEGF
ncbi:MAG: hypothetical protein WBL02_03395 [Methanomethylovorans sp.]|uniref:hypothetical protein n=1 Tax=Methanomethylovorans sp. TaxID=2758717 RepID=UPI000AE75263|nr:hypothetical protein [Methanomethylovorans sp.]